MSQNAAQLDLQNGPPILTLFISIIIGWSRARPHVLTTRISV